MNGEKDRIQKLGYIAEPLIEWYQKNKRDLPWREHPDAYRVWVSEIMLQQTRVEAVKAYYLRFLEALPDIQALAGVPEEQLLKLWEGLGYYNRVRNMQKAAKIVVSEYGGRFPDSYTDVLNLPGIGSYTAGAISSIAYRLPYPAVDGNVMRVISRITNDDDDIAKERTKKKVEAELAEVIPKDAPGEFNQALMELGALICLPNGVPKCADCPVSGQCEAFQKGLQEVLPVKGKAAPRKVEKRTVLLFKDADRIGIKKRQAKGLLAGLYELPNLPGHLTDGEVIRFSREIGLTPIRIRSMGDAKHIFSHIEWHMIGWEIRVDELEKACTDKDMIFVTAEDIKKRRPIPAAFDAYTKTILKKD